MKSEDKMEAIFRLRGAEEIRVRGEAGGVTVEHYEGYVSQCDSCRLIGDGANCSECAKVPGTALKLAFGINYPKSEARAVASAMMAAAARL